MTSTDPIRPIQAATSSLTERAKQEAAEYAAGAERPLGGYLALMGTYATGVVGLGALVRRRRALPERFSVGDLALLGIGTHRLSRLVTKDSVGAPVRAPFTTFEEPAGDGEVHEAVRGHGLRHAVGELLTCPFCIAAWVATGLAYGMVLAPRATRMVASVATAVLVSDLLQFGYAAAQRAEQDD